MKITFAVASCLLANLIVHTVSFGAEMLENRLPRACQYQGQFDQTRTLEALLQPLRSSGRFLFDCKTGVIWQTDSPVSNTVIYTTKNTHFRINGSGEVKLLKGIVHNNMSVMLQALMGGDSEYLNRDFIAESVTESVAGTDGESSWAMTLLPKSTSVKRYIEKIRLEKKADSMHIELINNADESTHISTSAVTTFKASGEQECETTFGPQSFACEGLFFPARLADTLRSDR